MQLQPPTFMRTNFPEKVIFTIIYLKPKNFHENQFSRESRFHEYLPKTFDGDQKNWCKGVRMRASNKSLFGLDGNCC